MELSHDRIRPERVPKNLAEFLELLRRSGQDVAAPSPTAVRLAAALAERFGAVVPAQFRVSAEGGWVSRFVGAQWDGSSDVAGVLDGEPEASPFVDRVVSAGYHVLSSVQDMIAEATTEPWPRLPQGGMANPGTRADAGLVYLWYGPNSEHEEGAVLSLPPITLAALERD